MQPSQGLVATATGPRKGFVRHTVSVLLAQLLVLSIPCILRAGADSAVIARAAVETVSGVVAKSTPGTSTADELRASKSSTAESKSAAESDKNQFKHGDWPFFPVERPAAPKLTKLKSWARAIRSMILLVRSWKRRG